MTAPRVSIGLPVYNGQRFIEETITAILAQTWTDLELVISDNASTDRTEAICRAYAARDQRIRYFRNPDNFGAAENYNLAFRRARGEFFKWSAHDDLIAPEFVARCLTVLEADPGAVLCWPRTVDIDADGRPISDKQYELHADADDAVERFAEMIGMAHTCEAIFGLIRSAVLAQTPLIAPYADSDRVLLAELALRGRFRSLDEPMFFYRDHDERSTEVYPSRDERIAWFDPALAGRIVFPHFRQFVEYWRTPARAGLPARARWRCRVRLLPWAWQNRHRLLDDLKRAARKALRPAWRRLRALGGRARA